MTDSRQGNELILLAEDDDEVRRLCQRILEDQGYRVLPASNGEEAIMLYENNRDSLEMAIIDVVMPRKSGKEVYQAISSGNNKLPVLFYSGYRCNSIEELYTVKDEVDFLQKPFRKEDLLEKVQNLLETDMDIQSRLANEAITSEKT